MAPAEFQPSTYQRGVRQGSPPWALPFTLAMQGPLEKATAERSLRLISSLAYADNLNKFLTACLGSLLEPHIYT
jgi:hypothetical protein